MAKHARKANIFTYICVLLWFSWTQGALAAHRAREHNSIPKPVLGNPIGGPPTLTPLPHSFQPPCDQKKPTMEQYYVPQVVCHVGESSVCT